MPPAASLVAGAAMVASLASVAVPAAGRDAATAPAEPSGGRGIEISVEILDPAAPVDVPAAAAAGESPELEVLSAGRPVAAVDRGLAAGDWQVTVFFDQGFTDPLIFRNAAVILAQRARELTALGSVEVVLADREVRRGLAATRDPDVLGEYLSWLRVRESSADLQERVRQELLAELRAAREEEREGGEEAAAAASAATAATAAIRGARAEEASLLSGYADRLLAWAARAPAAGPRLLLYVGGGFDAGLDPFYDALLGEPEGGRAESGRPRTPSLDELGKALAALGWVVVPLRPAARGDVLLAEDEEGQATPPPEGVETVVESAPTGDRTVMGVDPRKLLRQARERRERARQEPPLVADPGAVLRSLAEATGGEVIEDTLQLGSLFARLPARRRLHLEIGGETGEGLLPVDVRLRGAGEGPPGAAPVVRHPRWVSALLPEAVSAARARRYLDDELDDGEMPISAVLEGSGNEDRRLVLRLEPEAVAEEATPMRVTVALPRADGPPVIVHRLLSGLVSPEPAGTEAAAEGRLFALPLPVAEDTEELVAVLVEDLAGGRRGAALASRIELPETPAALADFEDFVLPMPKPIHLLRPDSGMLMGETSFRAIVSEEEVAQVDFYLDGEREAVRRSQPFSAILDLGRLPQTRRIEAVALDAAGRELGRDGMLVNEGGGSFRVWIRQPAPRRPGEEPPRLSGVVEVAADVRTPPGSRVRKLEFFWKTDRVAIRYAPPFRQRIVIPATAPEGFIRVVAHLEDGSTAEDVRFVNMTGPSERLQVDLVELYVVVTDRRGRPVRDLPRDRFEVLEDGEPQAIEAFGDAGDHPLTVGLAIDSSASMFVKLPQVRLTAAEFLHGLAPRRDRAFLVGFGGQPTLQRAVTTDLGQVARALESLRPDGRTAIWEAIVFSLVQLQSVPGKKALIVYSDGADEDPDFSYRLCLRFARLVGVPIYVVLTNNEIVRTEGKSLNVRGFLGRLRELTAAVGGRVYMTRVGADLDAVYREISEELRSQYLLGYYATDTAGEEWRRLEVRVKGLGLDARTIAGYYR